VTFSDPSLWPKEEGGTTRPRPLGGGGIKKIPVLLFSFTSKEGRGSVVSSYFSDDEGRGGGEVSVSYNLWKRKKPSFRLLPHGGTALSSALKKDNASRLHEELPGEKEGG